MEDILQFFAIHLRSYHTHNRNHNHSSHHGNSTCINWRRNKLKEHICYRNTYTTGKACPNSGFGYTLPVKTVHKWCQEGSSQCPPGNTHKLCYKSRWIHGYHNTDYNEEYKHHSHPGKLFLFIHIFDDIVFQ